MSDQEEKRELYDLLKEPRHTFDKDEIRRLFTRVDKARVEDLSARLKTDLAENLPKIYGRRSSISDYRTNPYVMLATTNIMELSDPEKFADFLFNSKLTMGLETSFGKVVERAFVNGYPCDRNVKWADPEEKLAEFAEEKKAKGRAAKAAIRNKSVWREIDKTVVVGNRRFLTSIKSGPNTINDTQVQGMVDAIATKGRTWLDMSDLANPGLDGIDIVVGLTYGTERSTNNKDNQILAKLLDLGFEELNQSTHPGVLVDTETGRIRVYRRVGQRFWSWIGNPEDEEAEPHIFVEVLLSLCLALKALLREGSTIEEGINERLRRLSSALLKMTISPDTLPDWLEDDGLEEEELFYLVTALSSFYDEGI